MLTNNEGCVLFINVGIGRYTHISGLLNTQINLRSLFLGYSNLCIEVGRYNMYKTIFIDIEFVGVNFLRYFVRLIFQI